LLKKLKIKFNRRRRATTELSQDEQDEKPIIKRKYKCRLKAQAWIALLIITAMVSMVTTSALSSRHSNEKYCDCEPEVEIRIVELVRYIEVEPPIAEELEDESIDDVYNSDYQDNTSEQQEWISIGYFDVTGYCLCRRCCGQWSGGPTASGVMPTGGRTVAATVNIPFGTEIYIDGIGERIVEDRGVPRHDVIDVYFDSHCSLYEFGRSRREVWVRNENYWLNGLQS
jgi:3D (Asp-Asp-Asp) domain-containing protein